MARFTSVLLAALAAVSLVACSEDGDGHRRPNVLLISIDTLRPDHLGCYGYERETSPVIDALAARGVLFERAYSHSPKTALSHMSMLTGLYPASHGVRQQNDPAARRLSDDIPTLGSILADAGYRCAGVTGGGNVHADLGFDRGMESYESVRKVERAVTTAKAKIDEITATGAPFFLFFHTYAVHDPYTPKAEFARLFANPDYDGRIPASREEIEASGSFEDLHGAYWSTVDAGDPRDVQRLVDLYDASIRQADAALGELLAFLDERDLTGDTLILLLSDHGEEFLDHGGFLHERMYEELLRVPEILVLPDGRHGGTRVDSIVRLIDTLPTILDYLGIEPPPACQGQSLRTLLEGGAAPPRVVLSSWENAGLRSLLLDDWKLIESPAGREFYDLASDPGEQRNVAGQGIGATRRLIGELNMLSTSAREVGRRMKPGAETAPDAEALQTLKDLGYVE